jgi:sugar lactone lactonase YvrE
MIYTCDIRFNGVIKWKYYSEEGELVAGGNGNEDQFNQLASLRDVIIDKKNNSLIICDRNNQQVVRWSLRNGTNKQIIISNIDCNGLAIDNDGDLYISELNNDQVTRWETEDTNGTIVAGRNERGNHFNQLDRPTYLFVDQNHSVYISDTANHRVMKWIKRCKRRHSCCWRKRYRT